MRHNMMTEKIPKLTKLIRKLLPENIKTVIHLKEDEFSGYTYCGIDSEDAMAFISGEWQLPPNFVCDECFNMVELELAVLDI